MVFLAFMTTNIFTKNWSGVHYCLIDFTAKKREAREIR